MPNYCTNILEIHGEDEDIEKFLTAIRTSEDYYGYNILSNLLPTPKELAETPSAWYGDKTLQAEQNEKEANNIAKYGYKDWYDWNCANWGTKWTDDQTHIVKQQPTYCSLLFTTAWCAPEKAFDRIATMFPSLTFILSYYEEGNGFVGATAYKNDLRSESYTEEIDIPFSEDEYDFDAISEAYEAMREACVLQVKEQIYDAV